MTTRSPAPLLAIGDTRHPDLVEAAAWLSQQQAIWRGNCDEALRTIIAGAHELPGVSPFSPHWIFLLAATRGSFGLEAIERLHRAVPLARLVMVCGGWCEGEVRSGALPPGVTRVYGHQFPTRCGVVLDPRQDFAGWTLPRTATALDVMLAAAGPTRRTNREFVAPTIGVMAPTRRDFAAIDDLLSTLGTRARRVHDVAPADDVAAGLWLGGSLRGTRRPLPSAASRAALPWLALVDFPRADEIKHAAHLGFAGVLGLPLLRGDLIQALRERGALPAEQTTREAG